MYIISTSHTKNTTCSLPNPSKPGANYTCGSFLPFWPQPAAAWSALVCLVSVDLFHEYGSVQCTWYSTVLSVCVVMNGSGLLFHCWVWCNDSCKGSGRSTWLLKSLWKWRWWPSKNSFIWTLELVSYHPYKSCCHAFDSLAFLWLHWIMCVFVCFYARAWLVWLRWDIQVS